MTRERRYRRGYPVAVLVGFGEYQAVLWHVFSNVTKLHITVKLAGRRTDEKALYSFHESIINALRPTVSEGVRSIMLAAPPRTDFAGAFLSHVRGHHQWLAQEGGSSAARFGEIVGTASQPHEVAKLVKTERFKHLMDETTSEDADQVIGTLEKRLSSNATILYSLKEIEALIYSELKAGKLWPEYVMLTDEYLAGSREKNRINRLLQIANNKHVKTRIVNAETPAGKRLTQLGGLVCFTTN